MISWLASYKYWVAIEPRRKKMSIMPIEIILSSIFTKLVKHSNPIKSFRFIIIIPEAHIYSKMMIK